jgi:phosphomannomutase
VAAGTIKFGTDGWRGIIASDFTFENVRFLAQAIASYVLTKGLALQGVIVGYDTRFASENFAQSVAYVLCGNGVNTWLCSSPTPTPVVSFGVRKTGAAMGVIITASHNPPLWNGIKLRMSDGTPATSEVVAEVERKLGQEEVRSSEGDVELVDLRKDYIDYLSCLPVVAEVKEGRLKVVADPMHGAGAGFLPQILEGGAISLEEINSERNPLFPGMSQPEPISKNLGRLKAQVVEGGADVGLALDADADRLGVVDEKGKFLTTHEVFSLLSLYLLDVLNLRGPIVRTVTSTSMLQRLGKMYGVDVYEVPVGFKYVAAKMLEVNALIGGEESGGYGFRKHMPERDGILSSLFFLDLMVKKGKKPSGLREELFSLVGPHYYQRVDVPLSEDKKEGLKARLAGLHPREVAGKKITSIQRMDGLHLGTGEFWLLLRPSGTEPLVRIYAEGETEREAGDFIQEGKRLLGVDG